ncbi:cupin domain-containing protein [Roseomonas sp. SSH11]|uniref:Cupin domain-containing protein n=1 Tax=Pararoseomonas baculiformis TaxID=2820812 RepID=A0ABS4ACZ9_9PROT|nr:cupin domain-containing protein [Pararoseomonas baculiformis]MBP0444874.1 cupin domain-containing protein [Pararoseomonas baculiformis]
MRTTVSKAAGASYDAGLRGFFAYRDLGAREATGGGHAAHIIRAVPGEGPKPQWHTHDLDFQLVLVLRGWVRFEYEDIGEVLLEVGDSVIQPPGIRHREVEHSEDLEMLEVTSPAAFHTAGAEPPALRAEAG